MRIRESSIMRASTGLRTNQYLVFFMSTPPSTKTIWQRDRECKCAISLGAGRRYSVDSFFRVSMISAAVRSNNIIFDPSTSSPGTR